MQQHLIETDTLERAMYEALVAAALVLPADVKGALVNCLEKERQPLAKLQLEAIMKNCDRGEAIGRLPCPDTGYPGFYVRVGDCVKIRGGLSVVSQVAAKAVQKATVEGRLRPNMVHPLSRKNPGTNVGSFVPEVRFQFVPDVDFLEVTAVPKGGGGEIFGTFYRMLVPADGKKGIMKFVLDSIQTAVFAGEDLSAQHCWHRNRRDCGHLHENCQGRRGPPPRRQPPSRKRNFRVGGRIARDDGRLRHRPDGFPRLVRVSRHPHRVCGMPCRRPPGCRQLSVLSGPAKDGRITGDEIVYSDFPSRDHR